MTDGGTLRLISDMSPSDSGQPGQIIGYVHDSDRIVYVAPSFEEFLVGSLDALEENIEDYFS